MSQESATSDIVPDTFVELKVLGEEVTAAPKPSSAISIREIRIRFSNGMLLHGRADNLDETLNLVRKLLSYMLNLSNEYAVYLYSGKVDMRKGIDGKQISVFGDMCAKYYIVL